MEHPHDLTLYVASGAILTAPFVASAMQKSRRWMIVRHEPFVSADVVIRYAVALVSVGAGVIHLGASADHYAESLLAGLLMSSVGWFQLLWPATMLADAPRRLSLAALAVNAGTVAVWLASRTLGVPVPLGDGGVEPVGALDLLATSFEVMVVLGVTALLVCSERLGAAITSARSASLAVAALGVMVVVLVTASMAGGVPHGH